MTGRKPPPRVVVLAHALMIGRDEWDWHRIAPADAKLWERTARYVLIPARKPKRKTR